MRLALTNLDNGLFLKKNRWISNCGLADVFFDVETVSKLASEKGIKNAAAAIVDGDPPSTKGFLWLTAPNPN